VVADLDHHIAQAVRKPVQDEDSRLADLLLEAAAEAPLYRTERNKPYGPEDGVPHTLILHRLSNGLRNMMIEVRHDL
ncbi:hypothetical protein ACC720_39785, partial [Rhizobium ruizarguesonis]